MGIPVLTFPAPALPLHLNTDVRTGRRRKQPLDLRQCELLEMLQYDCSEIRESVRCVPIERLFRRCKDAASGKRVIVEVTAVETAPWRVGEGA